MKTRTAVFEEAGSLSQNLVAHRRKLLPLLMLSAWCGLVAGLLEVGTIILRKRVIGANRIFGMSRHFVWLIPVTDLWIFLCLGIVIASLLVWRPSQGRWLPGRLLCASTLLPTLLVAIPEIYFLAWLILTLGITSWVAPVLEQYAGALRRWAKISLPVLLGLVAVLAACPFSDDWIREQRETDRPLPAPGSPNVLWIVLDTVGTDHLSLFGYQHRTSPTRGYAAVFNNIDESLLGYQHRTSPTLEELARRGIRFDRAQATAPWTLPSHASMFTGRWPHELTAGWMAPLDAADPTVAEYLGAKGYATAGFVANRFYCGWDSGLSRGFTHYQDHALLRLGGFRLAALVDRFVEGLLQVDRFRRNWLGFDLIPPVEDFVIGLFTGGDRKEAAAVNREFLAWLCGRRQPERPFFVFLNYFDAHYPYLVPKEHVHRFGARPVTQQEWDIIENWRTVDKSTLSVQDITFARDAYDSCVADLDEQLGLLLDELEDLGVLEKTWVIITSDHGESFGEHGGFGHGGSLYQTELHVPLLIVPPGRNRPARVVTQTATLRNLPATIVDLLDLKAGSPFPGESLARLWNVSTPGEVPSDQAVSEVAPTGPFDPNRLWLPVFQDPIASLAEDDWVLIRQEGEPYEQLFNVREDPKEVHNLARDPATQPRMQQMRKTLDGLTGGLLTLERLKR
jgi:arylsulfatase A-like enzyme